MFPYSDCSKPPSPILQEGATRGQCDVKQQAVTLSSLTYTFSHEGSCTSASLWCQVYKVKHTSPTHFSFLRWTEMSETVFEGLHEISIFTTSWEQDYEEAQGFLM